MHIVHRDIPWNRGNQSQLWMGKGDREGGRITAMFVTKLSQTRVHLPAVLELSVKHLYSTVLNKVTSACTSDGNKQQFRQTFE